MGAGRADLTGACTTEIWLKEESSKGKEIVTKDQSDHKNTSTNQDQAASNNSLSMQLGDNSPIPGCLKRNRSWSLNWVTEVISQVVAIQLHHVPFSSKDHL